MTLITISSLGVVLILSTLGATVYFMRKLLIENQDLTRQMVKEQRLLAEKAFNQLKAQSVEQAVNASEMELRYKMQRDAARDEMAKFAERAASEHQQVGNISQEVYTDVHGNQYKAEDLEIEFR